MGLRVTKPVTKYGRYYASGDIIDQPSSTEQSLGRMYGWEQVNDSAPSLGGMKKAELVQLAEDRGLDVSGLTKKDLLDVLDG